MKKFDLPCYRTRKSFYGKAAVEEHDDGTAVLFSYNTPVCKLTPGGYFVRLWASYSATTTRHVDSFLIHYGHNNGGKAFWDACPVNTPVKL